MIQACPIQQNIQMVVPQSLLQSGLDRIPLGTPSHLSIYVFQTHGGDPPVMYEYSVHVQR